MVMDPRLKKRILRYLSRQEALCRIRIDELDMTTWFLHWHIHLDPRCRANGARRRVAHLIYKLLLRAEARCDGRAEPIQAWGTICENTGYSAVWLHSPNPHKPFPYSFDGVKWLPEAPAELMGLPCTAHEIGCQHDERGTTYYLRNRAWRLREGTG
jgi:hypothetical protein